MQSQGRFEEREQGNMKMREREHEVTEIRKE